MDRPTFLWYIPLSIVSGFASPISQLSLAPTYGGLPANAYHSHIKLAGFIAGCLISAIWNPRPGSLLFKLIPLLAFSVPAVQHVVSTFSNDLGPLVGPVFTQLLSYFPLLTLTAGGVLATIRADLADTGYGIWSVNKTFLKLFFFLCYNFPPVNDRFGSWLSNAAIPVSSYHLLLGLAYVALWPSKLSFAAALPALHTIIFNPYFFLNKRTANEILGREGFRLIARKQSLTGYISVLENVQDHYRVMRCDHSLLGGIWIRHAGKAIAHLREPVFAIFVVLEAVRLVRPALSALESRIRVDTQSSALIM